MDIEASYEKWLKNTEADDAVARGGGGERDRYGGGRGEGEGGAFAVTKQIGRRLSPRDQERLCAVAEVQTSAQSDPHSLLRETATAVLGARVCVSSLLRLSSRFHDGPVLPR
ncbi:hypothetical protein ALC56_02198 [Trachymyrmex septentrionalis]|uniref:Uncharacterized protein n=1 Tax=Trachymyrmex septentrionalis TaxID=34720 RepID=A0A195FT44_9HYME|nr:hypothetical protein ALC56_02198 [Trachymyrmex septentrionalis]